MSFLAPLFLIGTIAGLIPVALHLIHRQTSREIRYPTLRFLRASVQRTRRRKYIDDALLLALRVGALLLLALGLARPAIEGLRGLLGRGSTTAVVLVLDSSGSMALSDAGQPRFETARAAAGRILEGLRGGDAAALILTGGPAPVAVQRLTQRVDRVEQALAEAQASPHRADLFRSVERALALLRASRAGRRELYVLTDNQRVSWSGLADAGEQARAGEGIALIVLDTRSEPALNVALRDVTLRSPAPVTGVPVQVSVRVHNPTALAQQRHAELLVGGLRVATSPTLAIGPGETLTHAFTYEPDRPGLHRGEVRLVEEDGLALDDRLWLTVQADARVPVAIVTAAAAPIAYADDAFYLERALALGQSGEGAIRVTRWTAADLAAARLEEQAVIYIVNVPALDAAAAARLAGYVRGGGHVVWVAGESVVPEAYNRMNDAAGGDLLPAPLGAQRTPPPDRAGSWAIGELDASDPAIGALAEPASLYRSVLVHRQVTASVRGATGAARTLLRLDDGEPLLLSREVGSGSVVYLGTAARVEWTNLPIKPLFLPMIARLTFAMAGAGREQQALTVGQPLRIPRRGGEAVEVVRPDGAVVRLRPQEGETGPLTYGDTFAPGVYLARGAEGAGLGPIGFAVNPDPEEADDTPEPAERLRAALGRDGVILASAREDIGRLTRRLREGTPLGGGFLLAALALLLLEGWLSNRPDQRAAAAAAAAGPARPSGPRTRLELAPGQGVVEIAEEA
jgi:hypothetical protein